MTDQTQHVLVLGGTGHIGAAIARHFATEGYVVKASGRCTRPRANLDGTDIAQLGGDDTAPANLNAWSKDVDIIIDAATPYPLWRHGSNARTVVRAARDRISRIIALAQHRDAALVHISSFTTLPATGSIAERLRISAIRGMHPYFEVKEVVEAEVLGALDGGLRGCVVNPSACFGPYDLKSPEQAFIPMLVNGKVSGTVKHPMNVVDIRDVAACIAAAVRAGYLARRMPVFGHNIKVDDLTRYVCTIAGVTPPKMQAPMLLGLAGAYWAETAAAVAGRKSPWPSLPVLLTAAGRNMAPSAAQTALGLHVRPLGDTLNDAVAWYRQIGHC